MKLLTYIFLALCISQLSFAQEDVDAGFKQVKIEAENKNYNEALKILNGLEQKYPGNEDIKIYQGRIYSWKRDFSKAKKILRPLVEREKPNKEALQALIYSCEWASDWEECIRYCDKYAEIDPSDTSMLVIKASCLEKLNRDDEALAIIEKLGFPKDALETAISRKKKNAISASYLNISTADPGESPTHYGYVEYLRKLKKSTIIGRANIGNRYGETEGQLEADFYHTFKKGYMYANAGASNGEFIFPQAKLGAEYYFAPQRQFDFSFGARYMHFEDDDVVLLTGQAGYRFGEYTLAYRPYYDVNNTLFSHVLSLQKYNETKENLLRLELQYGNVPYLYIYSNSTEPLTAYRAGIQYQHRFGDSFFIRPIFLYEYEEYIPDSYRNKFNCQIIFTKRF
jgi:YaiO family outer membrane protein